MDIVICRDVIEHISNEKKIVAIKNMTRFLSKGSLLFISFPPKYSPFAGHQQNISNKLGKIPYLFLLPNKLYTFYLKILRVPETTIQTLLYTKRQRISVWEFEKMIKQIGLKILSREYFIIRPIFEYRYDIKRKKVKFLNSYLKEFLTLGATYILTK